MLSFPVIHPTRNGVIKTVHKNAPKTPFMEYSTSPFNMYEKGIIATPANSYVNELVVEAARLSILNDGDMVTIEYGQHPEIALRGKN